MESVIELLGNNLEFIVVTLAGLVGSFVWRNSSNKKDAVASLKTGVAAFLQSNPGIKGSLLDGKVSSEEWTQMFTEVGPTAVGVATRGGAKVLKRWTGPVANKYIEAVANGLASEFTTVVPAPGVVEG